jgi:hypothetical protein
LPLAIETIVNENNNMTPYLASFSSPKLEKSFFLTNNNTLKKQLLLFSDLFNSLARQL